MGIGAGAECGQDRGLTETERGRFWKGTLVHTWMST